MESTERTELEDQDVVAVFDSLLGSVGPYGAIREEDYDRLLSEAREAVGKSLFATALTTINDKA